MDKPNTEPTQHIDPVILGAGNISPFFRETGGSRLAMIPQATIDAARGPNPEQFAQTAEDLMIPLPELINPFHACIPGVRGAMFPDAAFKATEQHGARGVICEVYPDTKIPDFKLSDIPGVRREN